MHLGGKIMSVVINTNVVNHLFITVSCPVCNQPIEVSLGMVHREEAGICPHCISPMTLTMEREKLDSFVYAFDDFYEQLREYELPLTFSEMPVGTPLISD